MDSDELLSLVESLNEQVWGLDADQLRAKQALFLEVLAARSISLSAVLQELSDESLAVMFRAGFLPAEAFTALLVDRYGRYMARWLARWGTEPNQALDLMQQIYVNFYECGLASYHPEQNFRAYLRRSVYHLWIAKVCRAKKHHPFGQGQEPVSPQPGPEQSMLDREGVQRIDEALAQLPPREQSVVRETMAGKSADEVAAALGLRKPQVFMSLFRGRRRLEQWLSLPRKSRSTKDGISRLVEHHQEPSYV